MVELDLLALPIIHDAKQTGTTRLLALFAVCFFASWMTTAARLFVRLRMLESMGKDDFVMLVAELSFTIYLVTLVLSTIHGAGTHIEFLRQADAEKALMYWYISVFFYVISTCFVKASIAFFLLRFAQTRFQRWTIYAMKGACFSVAPIYCIFWLQVCRPLSYWWTLSPDAKGSCLPAEIFLYTTYVASALNALVNLVFAVVPILIVRNSLMDRKTRILTATLLGFGSFAVIVTIARIPFERSYAQYKGDFLYDTTPVVMLSVAEVGIGIMTANAATLKPLVKRLWTSSCLGGRWQNSSDQQEDEEAAWQAMCRVARKAGMENPGMKSLTGRESIGRMPSLTLVVDLGKPLDESGSRPSSSLSSHSSPFRTNIHRMSKASWQIQAIAE